MADDSLARSPPLPVAASTQRRPRQIPMSSRDGGCGGGGGCGGSEGRSSTDAESSLLKSFSGRLDLDQVSVLSLNSNYDYRSGLLDLSEASVRASVTPESQFKAPLPPPPLKSIANAPAKLFSPNEADKENACPNNQDPSKRNPAFRVQADVLGDGQLLMGEDAMEASQHDIQLDDGDLDDLDDDFSDLSDEDDDDDDEKIKNQPPSAEVQLSDFRQKMFAHLFPSKQQTPSSSSSSSSPIDAAKDISARFFLPQSGADDSATPFSSAASSRVAAPDTKTFDVPRGEEDPFRESSLSFKYLKPLTLLDSTTDTQNASVLDVDVEGLPKSLPSRFELTDISFPTPDGGGVFELSLSVGGGGGAVNPFDATASPQQLSESLFDEAEVMDAEGARRRIDEEQREFEKENRFRPDEVFEKNTDRLADDSLFGGDGGNGKEKEEEGRPKSFRSPRMSMLPTERRPSSVNAKTPVEADDVSFVSEMSFGAWARKRSEPLGSLGEEGDPCNRPTMGFGAPIVSPPLHRAGPGPLYTSQVEEEDEVTLSSTLDGSVQSDIRVGLAAKGNATYGVSAIDLDHDDYDGSGIGLGESRVVSEHLVGPSTGHSDNLTYNLPASTKMDDEAPSTADNSISFEESSPANASYAPPNISAISAAILSASTDSPMQLAQMIVQLSQQADAAKQRLKTDTKKPAIDDATTKPTSLDQDTSLSTDTETTTEYEPGCYSTSSSRLSSTRSLPTIDSNPPSNLSRASESSDTLMEESDDARTESADTVCPAAKVSAAKYFNHHDDDRRTSVVRPTQHRSFLSESQIEKYTSPTIESNLSRLTAASESIVDKYLNQSGLSATPARPIGNDVGPSASFRLRIAREGNETTNAAERPHSSEGGYGARSRSPPQPNQPPNAAAATGWGRCSSASVQSLPRNFVTGRDEGGYASEPVTSRGRWNESAPSNISVYSQSGASYSKASTEAVLCSRESSGAITKHSKIPKLVKKPVTNHSTSYTALPNSSAPQSKPSLNSSLKIEASKKSAQGTVSEKPLPTKLDPATSNNSAPAPPPRQIGKHVIPTASVTKDFEESSTLTDSRTESSNLKVAQTSELSTSSSDSSLPSEVDVDQISGLAGSILQRLNAEREARAGRVHVIPVNDTGDHRVVWTKPLSPERAETAKEEKRSSSTGASKVADPKRSSTPVKDGESSNDDHEISHIPSEGQADKTMESPPGSAEMIAPAKAKPRPRNDPKEIVVSSTYDGIPPVVPFIPTDQQSLQRFADPSNFTSGSGPPHPPMMVSEPALLAGQSLMSGSHAVKYFEESGKTRSHSVLSGIGSSISAFAPFVPTSFPRGINPNSAALHQQIINAHLSEIQQQQQQPFGPAAYPSSLVSHPASSFAPNYFAPGESQPFTTHQDRLSNFSSASSVISNASSTSVTETAFVEPRQALGTPKAQEKARFASDKPPVKVVGDFKFPGVCCLGMSLQGFLDLENETDHWLRCSLRTTASSNQDPSSSNVFRVEDSISLSPRGVESVKITFQPSHAPSVVVGRLIVTCSRVRDEDIAPSSSSKPPPPLAGPPVSIPLQAVAELPNVQIVSESLDATDNVLDFGLVPSDCHRLHSVFFINRGEASIPVRLNIQSNLSNHGFYIERADGGAGGFEASSSAVKFLISGESRSSASFSQQAPPTTTVASQEFSVGFRSAYSADFGVPSQAQPPRLVGAVLVAELDVPGPVHILAAKKLRATSGFVRLRTSTNGLTLTAAKGGKGSAVVSVQNAGNIQMGVDAVVRCFDAAGKKIDADAEKLPIKVWPSKVFVPPHQKTKDLLVKFAPEIEYSKAAPCRGVVLLKIDPNGPVFEVDVCGFDPQAIGKPAEAAAVASRLDATSEGDKTLTQVSAATSKTSVITAAAPAGANTLAKEVALLANKHYLAWSGVAVGKKESLSLMLKNPSDEVDMRVSLEVKTTGNDTQAFWIPTISPKDESELLVDRKDIIIQRGEEYPLRIVFKPTTVSDFTTKLVIKTLSGSRRKFSIPLLGYGGASALKFGPNVKPAAYFESGLFTEETQWVLVMTDSNPSGKNVVVKFQVTNVGSRTGFVRLGLYEDESLRVKLTSGAVHAQPNEFVLGVNETQIVVVVCPRAELLRRAGGDAASKPPLGFLTLFHGDEVMRARLRKALGNAPAPPNRLPASVHPCLTSYNFVSPYENESTTLPDRLQLGPSDVRLFYNSIKTTKLAVVVDEPQHEALDRRFQDLTFDETFRPLEETQLFTPSVLETARKQPGKNFLTQDVPMKDSSRVPPLNLNLTLGDAHSAAGAAPPSGVTTDSGVSSEKGAVRTPGATWSVTPESLSFALDSRESSSSVLGGMSVKIRNLAPMPLSFELSFPSHALSVTPSHGVVSSLSASTVSVAVAKQLVDAEDAIFPWRGNLYVNGDDGATVTVSVAVNRETPPLPPPLSSTQTILTLGSSSSSFLSELLFPPTRVGASSDALLLLRNGRRREALRWRLAAFSPTYLKHEGRQRAAGREVFRVVVSSGILKPECEAKVVVMFSPTEPGTYLQSWELEGVPDDGGARMNLRVQMAATASGSASAPFHDEAPLRPEKENVAPSAEKESRRSVAAVVPVVATVPSENVGKNVGPKRKSSGLSVTLKDHALKFPETEKGRASQVKLIIRNHTHEFRDVRIVRVAEPFFIRQKHLNIRIKPRSFLGVPIEFRPPEKGTFSTNVVVNVSSDETAVANISASCV